MDLILFEWVSGGRFKGSCKGPRYDIASSIPMFSQFVKCSIRDELNTYFLGGYRVGEKPSCALFLHLYHLLDKRLHSVASILPSSVRFSSLFLGFCCPLTDCETGEMVKLLSIILLVWEKIF